MASNATEEEFNFSASLFFNWFDYLVFILMLALPTLIGLYHGCYKGKQNTVSEYMQGGKNMAIFPITMSLISSHVSSSSILALPSEVYEFGTQVMATFILTFFIVYIISSFYLPVFYKLQLNSPYEYLEKRFNRTVRLTTSFMITISVILNIPVVIYIAALAFNQVTGLPVHVITLTMSLICIFYTTVGGLKGVVWSDTFQSLCIFISILVVAVIGCVVAGGPANIYKINSEGHRLEIFKVIWWFTIGLVTINLFSMFVGMLLYARYHDCDPFATKLISRTGQMVPLYIMDIAGHISGLPGTIISGIICASLGTMSASLNSISGTVYEDFLMIFSSKRPTDAQASFAMKIIVVVLGLICVGLVYVVEKLGAILQTAVSLTGMTNGAVVYVFTYGIIFPWGTSLGALTGLISSVTFVGWIAIGAQSAIAEGRLTFPGKITSVDGCSSDLVKQIAHNFTQTYEGVGSPVVTDGTVPLIYQLSYLHYVTSGVLIGFFVGITVDLIVGLQDLNSLDPDLIMPQLQRYVLEKQKTFSKDPVKNDYTLVKLKSDNADEENS
ncbi:sodium-coupled monocarboxylate transporter 1-like isoform X2 [Lycorma delicatula]|uniref:sodium-coupled monocarboxylate transporter 1-like isoform X2 n=1 Tax=Lycorma delicatula TaxID=130591 RepID=UPI003F5137E9